MIRVKYLLTIVFIGLCTFVVAAADTVFTYQGELNENGQVTNGLFDFEFVLWDALAGGNQVGSPIVINDVQVFDSRFTVELDFGASAFDNTSRWIGIIVEGTTLSPRQPITRAPYSIQTRGIVVDANNNVGIGTSTPTSPLHVEADPTTSPAVIFGHNTDAGNNLAYGVLGTSESNSGTGVCGTSSALSGLTRGVSGRSDSTFGTGVHGIAAASSGTTYGVYGENYSSSGTGVFGEAVAASGTTYGGSFESFSTSGTGVFGWAPSGTGTTYGVRGESNSTSGRGVFGIATAISGITYGGHFQNKSTFGTGVYGEATASSGVTWGVFGRSDSTTGRGVYGFAGATSGVNFGVIGFSASTSGRGVLGFNEASSGITYGGLFKSSSTTGRGVYGEANASSGVNYGGNFRSFSTSGRGLYGEAVANSGVNIGVYGRSNSSSGFDFYAAGAGQNYGSSSSRRWKSNIVPISDPLTKLAQMRGVYFDWDTEHGGQHDVGMIAEEVGEVLPEIVNYEENGVDAIGMDYSKMTSLLVEAVNALRSEKNDEISELREAHSTEINDLREQLSDLQQIVERLASNHDKENR